MSADTPKKPRKFPWGKIVLSVSLALNLLIFGMIGGAIMKFGGPPPPRSAGEMMAYGPYGRAFSRDDRDVLRQQLRSDASRWRENREAVKRDFTRVIEALRASPYNPDLVEQLLNEQQSRVDEQAQYSRGLMLKRLETMSAADRMNFADRLEGMLRHPPRRHPGEKH